VFPLPAFVVAAALAFALTPLIARLAWATGYLDHPEARKLHTSATALLGGVGVFLAALAGWLATAPWRGGGEREAIALLAGAGVALAWGLFDDRFGMGVVPKLVGQFAAAAILLTSVTLPDLGLPPGVTVVLAAVALVGLMNAVNFLDNMNGMVAGLAGIALLGFAAGSLFRGATGTAAAQLALAGACVGFLPWNFPNARIFLGDAGSLLLGYSLGASAVLAFAAAPPGWGRLGPLIALAYPAFDLLFVVVNRLREGRPVQQGGKDHSNHRLSSVIQCPKKTVMLLWVSGAALSASGLVVQSLNRPLPALLLSALWTALFLWTGRRLSSVPPIEAPPRARLARS
jgi:UDP-GlcNAc:undecaprenyl-phosphate GlcNAc-1-phosphate transferase